MTLQEFLGFSGLPKSTYEYACKAMERPESAENTRLKEEIRAIWLKSKKRYGYRKICMALRNEYSEKANHKKVLRLMNEMGIYAVLAGHGKKYSSYRGSIGKTCPNLIKRDFHTTTCLQKTGTDVTEFKCEWGKAYLSPIIDFHNDEIIAYSISESPNMAMIYGMMDMLHRDHPRTHNMILHSDQGWQYQMKDYQELLKKYGIIQSMSRKGNCLDNSKTENLFSKMKKEMFYGHEKEFHSYEELKKSIEEYIVWYNNERIVARLGGAPVSNRSIAPIPMLCYHSF